MFSSVGINNVGRIECSRRYKIKTSSALTNIQKTTITSSLYDRMTECIYNTPLTTYESGIAPEKVKYIPVLAQGKAAIQKINNDLGLGFDDWDLDFYTNMFKDVLKRDPTDVELFDLGQSNSEHSRHWFFGGEMIIDGEKKSQTLFQMVKSTLPAKSNSIIAFHDSSSSLEGFEVNRLGPNDPTQASAMSLKKLLLHPILTAETHNFPSGVAPFAGAETGTGGRLRDVQATGRGAHSLAGVSAYCVGNLNIPGQPMPWEPPVDQTPYPNNLAKPLNICIEASNGASDYGNKYGEPVLTGFCRSFGQRLPNGERVEWLKPIMFTAGVGWMDNQHSKKGDPEIGMILCKIGGPAYRIGMGGGAASSRNDDAANADLDFNAVQRGDAEMENRMNRVLRACIELGDKNPIISIHDQGAGGNGNVLKELVDPLGARIELRSIPVGDPTMSALEIWGAEYQENDAFLCYPQSLELLMTLARRENCLVSPVGQVTGDGRVVVVDKDGSTPFDMPLSLVLGKMPQKSFKFTSPKKILTPFILPADATVSSVLNRVLRLVDVGSKRFLTNKVDRSVTGLIAQQQCVGPLHTPLANVAVVAQSQFATTGCAFAVGEQPIKGLLNNAAQARLTVGEALTNLMWAKITKIEDIKASGNWMWAAKMEGEGAKMWEACEALCDALKVLGPSIDGGKDSLSMAAKVNGEVVKSPGQVTLTCYAACPDITKTVTPDLKYPGSGILLYVDLGGGKNRVGGTSLSTVYGQIGDVSPDVDDLGLLKRCFESVQQMVDLRLLASGHDRSDGGLLVTAIEMAIAGNVGIDIQLPSSESSTYDIVCQLFSEELGLLIEVLSQNLSQVMAMFADNNVPCITIGTVTIDKQIKVKVGNTVVLDESMTVLRDTWEATSFTLERMQCNPKCVDQEQAGMKDRKAPPYKVTFDVMLTPESIMNNPIKHKVAVIRQEGSNGDREMLAALYAAGLEAWDVNMRDLIDAKVTLDKFRGIVFCGGFSYADVNGSAKGWAGVIQFNDSLLQQFKSFRDRPDTFTLGICNGCQLMALLGWVPFPPYKNNSSSNAINDGVKPEEQPRFIHNESHRFESRWSTVTIQPSPSVLLKGMEGSTLGIWVAHGEGRAFFPNQNHLQDVLNSNLAPLRYVDDDNNITQTYPFNPNGSPNAIAGMCSPCGRHLAMMPHPERCVNTWQWPYLPETMKSALAAGPWIKMFQNAKTFCDSNSL